MITPSPQVNKTFDPPLAARPMPIRTGSLSMDPSPARSRARALRLRQATSMLGMRSLQGIHHLRSLTTLDKKARDRSGSNSGSNSGSSTGARSVASRKGTRDRPFVISYPVVDGGTPKAVLRRRSPSMVDREEKDRPWTFLPVLGPRASIVCGPILDMNEVDELQASMQTPTAEAGSPQNKRVGGVELWEVGADIDHDALREALEDRPAPVSSDPPSERVGEESTTLWSTSSSVEGGTEAPEVIASCWQNGPASSPRLRPRSINLDAPAAHGSEEPTSLPFSPPSRHDRTLCKQPCACDTIPQLHHQLANLCAGNSALLTLKAAHEETIAILRDKIRSQDETFSRQENIIAELTWQLKAKEAEQASMIDNFCAEIASQNREIAQLSEDKWYLMGRAEELESKVATPDDSVGHDGQGPGPAKSREETVDGSISTAVDDMVTVDLEGDRDDGKSQSPAESFHSAPSPPISDPAANIDSNDTPITMLSSVFSPRARSTVSNRSLYAATPTPNAWEAPGIQISTYSESQYSLVTPSCRDNKQSVRTNAFGMREGFSAAERCSRHPRDSYSAVAQAVLAATARLEQRSAGLQEDLAASASRSLKFEAQLAQQATLIQELTRPSAIVTSIAQVQVPELPILTYTKSWAVWLNRVTSTFAYLGLLDFIQRDVPRPEMSTWDATEMTDWSSRRQRAIVLLKHAVDDDILEDVLHLQGTKDITPGERAFGQFTSAMDDPHQLFGKITSLRRIVSSSATDVSWLDRIESADFDGIGGFTSLVLCIDKRHGVMYGTSADHYDALLPRLQETMARLFPDLKGSMFAEASDSGSPRMWRQLAIWMAKVVKRRQTDGHTREGGSL